MSDLIRKTMITLFVMTLVCPVMVSAKTGDDIELSDNPTLTLETDDPYEESKTG